jgi:hypothetical protein
MNASGKITIGFLYLAIFGCSFLFPAAAPAPSPAPTEFPTQTPEATAAQSLTPTITQSPTPSPTSLPYTMVEIEESEEKLASILLRECQNAQKIGQAPYIQIVADWCPSCRALKRSMKDERMIEAYRGTYILLADIDIWQNQLPKVGIYVTGVPSIFELDYEGKPTGRFITGAAWEENTPENMAPPLDGFFHPDN